MPKPGPELLARLLDEHAAALALYARQWSSSPEDIVQEALLQLMRESEAPANPVGWIYRVTRNLAISAARGHSRRARHERRAGTAQESWFESDPASKIDGATVTEMLSALPLEQREAIVLRVWGGLGFEQIAEMTSVSTSTAHRRYEAGLQTLREKESACEKASNRIQ